MEISRKIEDHSFFIPSITVPSIMNFIQNSVDFYLATVAVYIVLFQKKFKQGEDGGGVEDMLFWQNPWRFRFVTLPRDIPDKMKLHPWNFQKLLYTLWKFQGLYPRLVEIIHDVFLSTLYILLLGPWNFHILFFQYPWKFHVLNPSLYFFSEIAHSSSYTDNFLSPVYFRFLMSS